VPPEKELLRWAAKRELFRHHTGQGVGHVVISKQDLGVTIVGPGAEKGGRTRPLAVLARVSPLTSPESSSSCSSRPVPTMCRRARTP